ncbi:MAG: dethiobiotin synthase [Xanthomonadales bacterium]|nr:dethiobiotin synthase [Xanthomonadales bacterium]
MKHWYITGTDTEIGKTRVSCQLLQHLRQQGYSTSAYKPVASGALDAGEGLRNDDALQLIHASQTKTAYNEVNPWCFEEAVAPHLLAEEAGINIDTAHMADIVSRRPVDVAIIEGVGGWLAPLDADTSQADMARALNAGVILVVGMRLGCINHALLSVGRILQDGLPLLGWVANRIDPEMSRYQDNINTLKARIQQPLLATIAWEENTPDFSINPIIN